MPADHSFEQTGLGGRGSLCSVGVVLARRSAQIRQAAEARLVTTSAALLLLSLLAAGADAKPISERLQEELHELYPVRGVVWEDVRQTFWPHVRVLKLRSTAEPGAYHRPTVGVDASESPHVLTDGFFIVPPEAPIDAFNELAASENVEITEGNVTDYARFFLESHLLIGDDYCLSDSVPEFPVEGALSERLCSSMQPFTVTPRGLEFHVDTVLVNRKGRWARPYQFTIFADGRVHVRP